MSNPAVGIEGVPEKLLCPICFQIPDAEVYQCINGHPLCKTCFNKVNSCPVCRHQLNRDQPIRNRFIENELDELSLECPFKVNGCKEKPSRRAYPRHQAGCCYNFQKFGRFVNVCELLGFHNCPFRINNGNTKEAVTHLVQTHELNVTVIRYQTVRVELEDFKNRSNPEDKKSDIMWSWRPFIIDLPLKRCYILVSPVTKMDGSSFDLWALYLPYSKYPISSKSPVQLEYSLYAKKSTNHIGNLNATTTFSDSPMTIENAVKLRSFKNSEVTGKLRLQTSLLNSQFLDGDSQSLIIDLSFIDPTKTAPPKGVALIPHRMTCKSYMGYEIPLVNSSTASPTPSPALSKSKMNVEEAWEAEVLTPPESARNEEVEESDITPVLWNPNSKNQTARRILENQVDIYKNNRKRFEFLLDCVFCDRREQYPAGVRSKSHIDYLQYGSLFQAARYGNVDAVKYIIEKKLNLNVVHAETGETPLHWTMLDSDKQMGQEKAELLIENGANVNALTKQKWSLLHYAAMYSDSLAVHYFIAKGLDVNGVTLKGNSPLHLAIVNKLGQNAVYIVKVLLNNGADRTLQNSQGHTPQNWPKMYTHEYQQELRELLFLPTA